MIYSLVLTVLALTANAQETTCISNSVLDGMSKDELIQIYDDISAGRKLSAEVFCDPVHWDAVVRDYLSDMIFDGMRRASRSSESSGQIVIAPEDPNKKTRPVESWFYVGASGAVGAGGQAFGGSVSVNLSSSSASVGAVRASIGAMGGVKPYGETEDSWGPGTGRLDIVLPASMYLGHCNEDSDTCITTSFVRLLEKTPRSTQIGVLSSLIAAFSPIPLSVRQQLEDGTLEIAFQPMQALILDAYSGGVMAAIHFRLEKKLSQRLRLEAEAQAGVLYDIPSSEDPQLLPGYSRNTITGYHATGSVGLIINVNKHWFVRPEVNGESNYYKEFSGGSYEDIRPVNDFQGGLTVARKF